MTVEVPGGTVDPGVPLPPTVPSNTAGTPTGPGRWARLRDQWTLNFGSPAATLAALIGIATLIVTSLHWKADVDAAVPRASMWISPSVVNDFHPATVNLANPSRDSVRLTSVEVTSPPDAELSYEVPTSPVRKKLSFAAYAAPGNSTAVVFKIKHSDAVTSGKQVTVQVTLEYSGAVQTITATSMVSDDWFK